MLDLTTDELSYNLTGSIRHQGMPVARVFVSVIDVNNQMPSVQCLPGAGAIDCQKTGANGEFSFSLPPGNYRLELSPNSDTRFLSQTSQTIPVLANAALNLNLSTGLIVSGQVRTEKDEPVNVGAVVALSLEPHTYQAVCDLSKNGKYSLALPKGTYLIAYRPSVQREDTGAGTNDHAKNGHKDRISVTSPLLARQIDAVPIDADSKLDIVLPTLVEFDGEIANASGEPVPNAIVTVVASDTAHDATASELGLVAQVKSDNQGKFRLFVEPGSYDIAIEPEADSVLFGLRRKKVAITQVTQEKFVLADGFRLTGRVLWGEKGVPNSLVRIISSQKPRQFSTKTNSKGEFSVSLPGGSYRFAVSAPQKTAAIDGKESVSLAPVTSVVTVSGDWQLTFPLKEGIPLHGSIGDETGKSRPGVGVAVFLETDFPKTVKTVTNEIIQKALVSGTTDSEGKYRFLLAPGNYWLVVHDDFANAKKVKLGSEPRELNLVWQGWCQLRFEITGPQGENIRRCKLRYKPYPSENAQKQEATVIKLEDLIECDALVEGDGSYLVTLPAGIYAFAVVPPSTGSYQGKFLRQVSLITDLTRKIILPLKSEALAKSAAL